MKRGPWGVLFREHSRLDGAREHLLGRFYSDTPEVIPQGVPLLFGTRREARECIQKHFGYLPSRPDLRAEPHGWRAPLAVRVTIQPVKP